jgi:hypothetical protein
MEILSLLKNRGIVIPAEWRIAPDFSRQQVLDTVNKLTDKPIDLETLDELLTNANIQG